MISQHRRHMSTLHLRALRATRRTGSAGQALVLVLLLILGAIGYFLLSPAQEPETPDIGPVTHQTKPAEDPHKSHPTAPSGAGQRSSGTSSTAHLKDRFKGRGTLRGTVDLSIGDQFPSSWTLVIEASTSLAGAQHAEPRRVDFPGDQRDFEVEDLPLAGYNVRAEAKGFNGLGMPVLLERASPSAYLMLQISPSGYITGRVTNKLLEPLDGLEIWLFQGSPPAFGQPSEGSQMTKSLADGTYTFDQVLDGPHTLIFGAPIAPIVPPLALQFRAPVLTVPSPKFPDMTKLRLMITDEDNLPLAGAMIRGSGSNGGSFEYETLPDGILMLPHLVPGHYRFVVTHDLYKDGLLEANYKGTSTVTELLTLVPKP